MADALPRLTRLNPRVHSPYISQGRTVLITDPDGFFGPSPGHGMFVYQTRLLSHYRYRVNRSQPHAVGIGNINEHSSLSYYVVQSPGSRASKGKVPAEHVLELRLARFVGEGMHEEATLTNYTGKPVDCHLHIELDADFADLEETREGRKHKGKRTRTWNQVDPGVWEVAFDYHAQHAYDHQGEKGIARIHRGLIVRVEHTSSRPTYVNDTLHFRVKLAPLESWHVCLNFIAVFEGERLPLHYRSGDFFNQSDHPYERKRRSFLERATAFKMADSHTLTPIVAAALEQAKSDLASLRLYDLDRGDNAWTVAAGLPIYVGLFGRDTLMTAWQSGLLTADMMRGTLTVLPRYLGRTTNNWRDEQPGRLPHQVQEAPLSTLNYNPLGRYYGTISAPAFYPELLYMAWLWTADRGLLQACLDPALKSIQWLDTYGDL